MLTQFETLKKELKPLFEKAFYEQFNSHDQSIKKETNALFQAASNVEQLKNVLKSLDYLARYHYYENEEVANEINFELEGFISREGQPKTFWDSFLDMFKVQNTSWRIPLENQDNFNTAWRGTGYGIAPPSYIGPSEPLLDSRPLSLSAFEQLKENLKPLFKKAFPEQFGILTKNAEILTNAKSKEDLLNFLKVLDYSSRYEDFAYNGAKKAIADGINFELEGFTRRGGQPKTWWDSFVDFFTVAKESWRIGSTYSKLSAEDEAASIQEKLEDTLIKPSAKVSAPSAQVSPHHIIAPRSCPQSIVGPDINVTRSQKGLPKGADGSIQSLSALSNKKCSAQPDNPGPTNAATKFRSLLHPPTTLRRPIKGPQKH